MKNPDKHNPVLRKTVKLFLYFALVIGIIQGILWFYATPVLKKAVHWSVEKLSDSTYSASFEKLKINLFSGKIYINNFVLVPNIEYSNDRNLYEISFDKFILRRFDIGKLVFDKSLKLKEVSFIKPKVSIVNNGKKIDKIAAADSVPVSYALIKEDFLELFFKTINALEINRIAITDGQFNFLKQKLGKTFKADKITLLINDFNISRQTLSRKSLFAGSFEILIENYQVPLGNNQELTSKKLYISSADSTILMEKLKLKPLKLDTGFTYIDFETDKIKLTGTDFEDIYLNNRIQIKSAYASNPELILYNLKHGTKSGAKATPEGIYQMLKERNISLVKINSLHLTGTKFKQIDKLGTIPSIKTGKSDIKIEDILIDSTSFADSSRIFFAKNIFFDLNNVTVISDENYYAHAGKLTFSTIKKSGVARKIIYKLIPSDRVISQNSNLTDVVVIPYINIEGFDILKLYYKQLLELDQLRLNNATIRYIEKNKTGKNGKENGNKGKIKIKLLSIKNSKLDYFKVDTSGNTSHISGTINIQTKDLVFAPSKASQKFSVEGIDLGLKNVKVNSSAQTHLFKLEEFNLSSQKSEVKVSNLVIMPQDNIDSLLRTKGQSMSYYIKVPSLSLSKTDILNSLTNNEYKIKKFSVTNAEIAITSYPDIANKKIKTKLKNSVRDKAAANIIKYSSETSVELYQKVKEFSPLLYKLLKYKQAAIDTIAQYGIDAVYDIYIPVNKITVKDTSSAPTLAIEKIILEAYKTLKTQDLSLSQIDTIVTATKYRIERIRDKQKKPAFDIRQIAQSISGLAQNLQIDTFAIDNTRLKLFKRNDSSTTLVFDNKISLLLHKFHVDKDSLELCTQKLLCSESAKLTIKDYRFNLPDNIHKIKIDRIIFDSKDSSVTVENMFVNADSSNVSKNTLLISTTIPKVNFHGIDYWLYLDEHIFKINKISSENMFIHALQYQKDTTKTKDKVNKLVQITLPPAFLKQLQIDTIDLSGQIIFDNSKKTVDIRTKFAFEVNKFALDSITTTSQYTFFVPLDKFSLALSGLAVKSKGTKLTAGKLLFNQNIDIAGQNITLSTNNLKARLAKLQIITLDFDKLKNKNLDIGLIKLDSLDILPIAVKNDTAKKELKLDSIDLYAVINPALKRVAISKLDLNNIFYPIEGIKYKNFAVEAENILVDSTSTLRNPNLFYAQNWIVEVNEIEKDIKPYYYFVADKLKVDLKKQQILTENYVISTIKTYDEILKSLEWRTTLIDLRGSLLSINKINWEKLLFEQSIEAQNITLNDLIFYGYTDKSLPHNDSIIKPHYVEMLAKAPVPISIKQIKLVNGTIIYDEKNKDASDKGRIILNRVNALLTNVDNTKEGDQYVQLLMSTLLENQGELFIKGSFKIDTVHYPFRIMGSLNRFDMKKLNNFTKYAANFEINSGYLSSGKFYMDGFDNIVSGTMNLKYNNLSVTLLKNTKENKQKKQKFLSFVADVIVRKDNPKYGIFNKIGTIAYIHDPSYSDIKFWVKGIISGIKSVALKDNKRDIKYIMRMKEYYQNEIFGNSSRLKSINNNKLRKNE